jgi:hypothetical protein
MEHIKKVLKALKFNNTEIENLLDETKVDEQTEIITGWDARYSQVVGEKLKPIIETELKEANTQEIFNKQKEAIRKTRKSVNATLVLGLTAKQLDEMTDDDFNTTVKEHSSKETDAKLTDLQEQYKEEKRLRELAEGKLTEEVEKIKKEFADKDVQREVELTKARFIASKDATKFDKSNIKRIEREITGAVLEQNVSFLVEGDKIFVLDEKGQKKRNASNEFILCLDWLEQEITPSFEIKTKPTPDTRLDEKGNPIAPIEKSEAQIRLEETYKLKGIDTTAGATA